MNPALKYTIPVFIGHRLFRHDELLGTVRHVFTNCETQTPSYFTHTAKRVAQEELEYHGVTIGRRGWIRNLVSRRTPSA